MKEFSTVEFLQRKQFEIAPTSIERPRESYKRCLSAEIIWLHCELGFSNGKGLISRPCTRYGDAVKNGVLLEVRQKV